ncbi:LysR family transcriptional regulator [Cognatishimia sp. SS12]|uniref:LysR family transcriptional regulator n=1 Tax=Cognatishimia sp. SS12 TaxID=2979465 RepID=UPI00232FEEAB|nr:LysR family transcriptional regulator [Cognatishimia sp. SS12]MDC0738142.1 LysR family transcriptional regulator [Cognatishimia sp. SS12]
MLSKGVTLRGLEVFEALASSGSVALTATATGLSQPAVSQQLRNLETALGVDLIDHGKRPMQLTAAGRSFLARTTSVLSELRLAQSELTVMDLGHLSNLSIGIIDDFDNDLTPRLVTTLAENMQNCRFKMITASSIDITADMKAKRLHLGISASSGEVLDGVVEHPLVRDPFILVTPSEHTPRGGDLREAMRTLPFLRYERSQLISRQIEAHLSRMKLDIPERFEIGSHLALMACVARGIGWAITTPLGFMRATRFHDQVAAHPLPFAHFSRQISLYASMDWTDQVPRDVAQTVRHLVQDNIITPALRGHPFLEGELTVLTG